MTPLDDLAPDAQTVYRPPPGAQVAAERRRSAMPACIRKISRKDARLALWVANACDKVCPTLGARSVTTRMARVPSNAAYAPSARRASGCRARRRAPERSPLFRARKRAQMIAAGGALQGRGPATLACASAGCSGPNRTPAPGFTTHVPDPGHRARAASCPDVRSRVEGGERGDRSWAERPNTAARRARTTGMRGYHGPLAQSGRGHRREDRSAGRVPPHSADRPHS